MVKTKRFKNILWGATDEDPGLDIEERKESRTPARFGESEKGH